MLVFSMHDWLLVKKNAISALLPKTVISNLNQFKFTSMTLFARALLLKPDNHQISEVYPRPTHRDDINTKINYRSMSGFSNCPSVRPPARPGSARPPFSTVGVWPWVHIQYRKGSSIKGWMGGHLGIRWFLSKQRVSQKWLLLSSSSFSPWWLPSPSLAPSPRRPPWPAPPLNRPLALNGFHLPTTRLPMPTRLPTLRIHPTVMLTSVKRWVLFFGFLFELVMMGMSDPVTFQELHLKIKLIFFLSMTFA